MGLISHGNFHTSRFMACRKIVSNFRRKLYRQRNYLQHVIHNNVCFFIVRWFYRLIHERNLSLPDPIRTLKVVWTLALVLDTGRSFPYALVYVSMQFSFGRNVRETVRNYCKYDNNKKADHFRTIDVCLSPKKLRPFFFVSSIDRWFDPSASLRPRQRIEIPEHSVLTRWCSSLVVATYFTKQ